MKDQEEEIEDQFSQEQDKADQNRGHAGTSLNVGETIPYGQRIDKDDETRARSPDESDEDETEDLNLDQSPGGA
ncbi:hypothetical protein [Pedobacter antarcticus]|uniref:hypothetical protein n=1 Tax=Pedobacter antarcticus TaxID=34086 RepID=UPI001C597793|nr:hypothetical protein [Pedobacter antarcticus]